MKSSKLKQLAAVATLAAASQGAMASCSDQPYIGAICYTAASYCPAQTYMVAAGQLLPISQYSAVFSLLGTNFGGNGTTNFALPDLQGRTAVGTGNVGGLQPVVLGQKWGNENVSLNSAQLPAHNHQVSIAPGSLNGTLANTTVTGNVSVKPFNADATLTSPSAGPTAANNTVGAIRGSTSFAAPSTTPANQIAAPATVALNVASGAVTVPSAGVNLPTTVAGSNAPVPVRDPSLGLTACIAVQGLYPSRP